MDKRPKSMIEAERRQQEKASYLDSLTPNRRNRILQYEATHNRRLTLEEIRREFVPRAE